MGPGPRVSGPREDLEGENGRERNSGRSSSGSVRSTPADSRERFSFRTYRDPGAEARDPALRPAHEPLLAVLERSWGFTSFRPLQREAMDASLDGRDSLVVLPTGGGKSLCFQAPALRRATGSRVVVSPLISLMKDQVDGLRRQRRAAARLLQQLARAERAGGGRRPACATARYRLLYVSPERLVGDGSDGFRAAASARPASASSRSTKRTASATGATTSAPSTASSAQLRERLPGVSLHAFTATATDARARATSSAQLGLRDAGRPGRHLRPARTSSTASCRAPTLQQQVREVLDRHRGEAGIIYCISPQGRRRAGRVAARARASRALPYHAGLDDDERQPQPGRVRSTSDADVVVATVAFGMGIDRSRRALRPPRRRAEVARALPAGDRPRRPRRPRGRVRAALLGRRLPEVAR